MMMLMMLMLRNHMSYSKANSITASSHTSPRFLSISVRSYHFKILTKQNLSLRLCGFLKKTLFASRARPRAKRKMAITPGVYVFYGTHGGKILVGNHVFSVMRRYRTRVCKWVSNTVEPTWMMWPWWVKIPDEDFTGINPSIFAMQLLTVPTSVYLQRQRPLFCWQSRRHFELVNLTWHRFTFFDQI